MAIQSSSVWDEVTFYLISMSSKAQQGKNSYMKFQGKKLRTIEKNVFQKEKFILGQ